MLKRWFVLLWIVLPWLSIEAVENDQKTILVLSSRGGYGHTAAVNTLQALIGDQYHLQVVHPIDQLRIWGVPSGEQFYNMMLKRGWIRSMNFLARHVAPRLFHSRKNKLEKIVHAYIQANNPDLVISLIPYVNYPASEAARKERIPYLLITTDNDLRNWSHGLEKIRHPHFKVTIGYDLPTTRGLLLKKKVPESAIATIGLPLRPDFIEYRDPISIKQRYQIDLSKSVILVMMGGSGGKSAYEYARKIGAMNLSAHLMICTGRNIDLKKKINKIKLHPSNSMSVLGFTEKVPDLMAIADLIITKPGPGTINEAIAMQLPVLIDNVDVSLFWERANMDMVVQCGIGQRIKNYKDMKDILNTYLDNEVVKDGIEQSFVELPLNQFHARIQEIIEEMLELSVLEG